MHIWPGIISKKKKEYWYQIGKKNLKNKKYWYHACKSNSKILQEPARLVLKKFNIRTTLVYTRLWDPRTSKKGSAFKPVFFFSLANYHHISNFLITLTTITKGKERVFHFKSPKRGRNLFLLGEGVVTFMSKGW